MYTIHVYTDGACSGNPGPGGAAAVIIAGDTTGRFLAGYRMTTNNRMEIMAAIIGLEEAAQRCPAPGTRVVVHTDSQLVYGTMALGWKGKANGDLWQRLRKAAEILRTTHGATVTFEKVKGHAGDTWNDLADRLAVEARRQAPEKLLADMGYDATQCQTPETTPQDGTLRTALRQGAADGSAYGILAAMLASGELSLERLAAAMTLHLA